MHPTVIYYSGPASMNGTIAMFATAAVMGTVAKRVPSHHWLNMPGKEQHDLQQLICDSMFQLLCPVIK